MATSSNAAAEWYREWCARTPFVTRHTLQALVLAYASSWLSESMTLAVANVPFYTILKLEIYRLLLAPLFSSSILSLIFVAMTFHSMGARLEIALGSAQLLVLMATISTLTNLVFILLCFLLATFGFYEALFFRCQGFWSVLMGLIVIECLESPDGHRRLLFIPTPIPTKVYPLALFGLFSLFTGPRVDMALSMLIGWLYQRGFLNLLKPREALVLEWERGCLANLTTRPHYVTQASAQAGGAWTVATPSAESSHGFGFNAGSTASQPPRTADAEAGLPLLGGRGTKPPFAHPPSADGVQAAFPGGGQTLGRGVGEPSSTPRIPTVDREAARLARLHAVGARNPAAMGALATTDDGRWESQVQRLAEMGYSRTDALAALARHDGNLNAAVNDLTGL